MKNEAANEWLRQVDKLLDRYLSTIPASPNLDEPENVETNLRRWHVEAKAWNDELGNEIANLMRKRPRAVNEALHTSIGRRLSLFLEQGGSLSTVLDSRGAFCWPAFEYLSTDLSDARRHANKSDEEAKARIRNMQLSLAAFIDADNRIDCQS